MDLLTELPIGIILMDCVPHPSCRFPRRPAGPCLHLEDKGHADKISRIWCRAIAKLDLTILEGDRNQFFGFRNGGEDELMCS